MATYPKFARRRNRDSSIDSICTLCFQTIASADREEDLVHREEVHICDPDWASNHMYLRPDLRTRALRHPSIIRAG
jgi:hypothetical protein